MIAQPPPDRTQLWTVDPDTYGFSVRERIRRAWQALTGRDVAGYLSSKRRDHERGICRGRKVCLYCSQERVERLEKLLGDHHLHHLAPGSIGLPDGNGGWIEIDNAAEYADSLLCERTREALYR